MVTTTKKNVRKKAAKKTMGADASKVMLTWLQAQKVANFYLLNGKTVPAFLAKKLA